MLKIGAHFSIKGGIKNCIDEALKTKATAVGLFVGSQRTWKQSVLNKNDIAAFRDALAQSSLSAGDFVPHGSYLMNLGSPDDAALLKSRQHFFYELKRCEALGLQLYNFHPGATKNEIKVETCLERIAESVPKNGAPLRADALYSQINLAHAETSAIVTVLENVAGQGTTVGRTFEELRTIIDGVRDKTRVGVCLDTCHSFAAGYDLRTFEACEKTFSQFDKIVGFKYLKALHINDSKAEFDSHKDRHENLGHGAIGIECFRYIANDKRFLNIPMILETPSEDDISNWEKEIELFRALKDTKEGNEVELPSARLKRKLTEDEPIATKRKRKE